MSTVTVHCERRAACPGCGQMFQSQAIPGHHAPGIGRACPAVPKGARTDVVVFRRDGEEIAVVADGAELSGFFTADEVDAVVAEATDRF